MAFTRTLTPEPSVWLDWGRKTPAVSAPSAAALEFNIISSLGELSRHEQEWNILWANADGPARLFLSFNWLWHWHRAYHSGNSSELAIILGRHQGELVVIWPLVVSKQLGLRTVSFAGMPVSQYGDILVDRTRPEHAAWAMQAWSFAKARLAPDIVHLRKVRAESAAASIMGKLGARQSNRQLAPCIDLAGTANFQDFDQRFSVKDRKNRRRRRKMMTEHGTAGFRRLSGSAEAVAAFDQAMRWKRKWLEDGAMVSAALADVRFDRFFASVLAETDRPAGAEAFELTVNGKPVSIKIAITSGNYRGLHLTAYDRTHEKFSPGRLIVEEVVAASLGDGISALDFLAPAYPYKLDWTEDSIAVSDYSLPVTTAGRLYDRLYLRGLRPRLQWLANSGPQSLRRLGAALLKARDRH